MRSASKKKHILVKQQFKVLFTGVNVTSRALAAIDELEHVSYDK